MTEKDLFKLKEEIDEGKKELAQLEGAEKTLLGQLKKEFDCSSVKKAEKKVNQMTQEIEKLSKQIKKGLQEIDEKYYEQE